MSTPPAGMANGNMQGNQSQEMAPAAAPPPPPQPVVANGAGESSRTSSATHRVTPKRQVSSNACEPCRKRKSKCDGARPNCKSCSTLHMTECYYDLDKDLRRKGALRQEIHRLICRQEDYQFIIDSLCLTDDSELVGVVELLRSNQSIEVIASILRRNNNFSMMGQLQAASPTPAFRGDVGENAFATGAPFLEVTNQPNAHIQQESNLPIIQQESNLPIIQQESNLPINQSSLLMPNVVGPANQHPPYMNMNQSMNMPAFPSGDERQQQQTPPGVMGWYDEYGVWWPNPPQSN